MVASKTQLCHVRSNSLPTKLHPLFQQCDEHLRRLGASFCATSSSSSISHKLSGLEELHDYVEKLLQLPLTQQAFVQGRQEKWVDQMLNGSLRLLDMCSTAKDAILHTKECSREIQSIMRSRRRGAEVGIESEIRKYFASRKVVKNSIHKALGSLKIGETKGSLCPPNNLDNNNTETMALVGALREVEAVTLAVFESLLSFVCGPKAQAKISGWSLVSKLIMQSKKVGSCEENDQTSNTTNEFEKVDVVLNIFMRQVTSKCDQKLHVETVKNKLQNLEFCVQEYEERLERLFRRLIKTRVSLLNILNN